MGHLSGLALRRTAMHTDTSPDSRALVIGLGLAGLLPFFIAVAWALLHSINYMPLIIFSYYSAGILCFLAGSLWRHEGQQRALLIQSNAITLLAVFALVTFHVEHNYALFLLLTGYVWMLYVDLFKTDYSAWYKQFRSLLSIVVIALHVVLLMIR